MNKVSDKQINNINFNCLNKGIYLKTNTYKNDAVNFSSRCPTTRFKKLSTKVNEYVGSKIYKLLCVINDATFESNFKVKIGDTLLQPRGSKQNIKGNVIVSSDNKGNHIFRIQDKGKKLAEISTSKETNDYIYVDFMNTIDGRNDFRHLDKKLYDIILEHRILQNKKPNIRFYPVNSPLTSKDSIAPLNLFKQLGAKKNNYQNKRRLAKNTQ